MKTFDGKGDDYVRANTNLLMTKSAITVTLKDRWCHDNIDATTDVNLRTFDLVVPFSLYLESKIFHKYPVVLEKYM